MKDVVAGRLAALAVFGEVFNANAAGVGFLFVSAVAVLRFLENFLKSLDAHLLLLFGDAGSLCRIVNSSRLDQASEVGLLRCVRLFVFAEHAS